MKLATLFASVVLAVSAQQVTFYRDVLPILQSNCQGCHRPGEAAPMSFLTYTGTRPYAKAIREAVRMKRMPPWFADAPRGHFKNDPSLTPSDIDMLARWSDSGAAEGNAADAPPPVQFVDGWNIGTPDKVFEMPEPFSVPTSGVIEYQHVVVPTGFAEDRWVSAVEIRPGNRSVVHHVVAFVRAPGSQWLPEAKPGVPLGRVGGGLRNLTRPEDVPEFLLSYTPGRPPVGLQEGQARLIRAGSDIVFQLHYTTNGKAETDRSKVGLIFAKTAPRERVVTLPISNPTFAIPPGAPNHRVDAWATVKEPARLLRVIPHMHLRGKAFEVRVADTAAGSSQTVLRVPKYDFRWQNAYYLRQELELKPGMRIDCTAWFDNSANNPWNPDPKAEVRWGDQTFEEMMLNYVDIAVAPGTDPKRVMARPDYSAAGAQALRDQFVGAYRLVSFKTRFDDGRVTDPFGPKASGRITYEKSGRMSAQLMNPERPNPDSLADPVRTANLESATLTDLRGVLTGFIAYYGTFEVDPATRTVTHHVESCLYPSWVGTDLKRTYEFSGNQLTLSVRYPDRTGVLVWERYPD